MKPTYKWTPERGITRPITPEVVLQVVSDSAKDLGFSQAKKATLQRYFIHEFCKWMPLRRISEMTGSSNHTSTISSIRYCENDSKILSVADSIRKRIFLVATGQ